MPRSTTPRPLADGAVLPAHPPDDASSSPVELPRAVRGAVIIPAHDEGNVIARTLRSLAPLAQLPGIEVIVACNGCIDDTADIAAGFPGVRVVETDAASKPAGLNLGDATATAWPRLYLDADIEIAPSAVVAVFDALAVPGVLAARPWYGYDISGATAPVRAYYRARSRATAPATRLWGAGGYAVGEAGHARFDRFPAMTADDSWFDSRFDEHEKRVVPTVPMRVRTPRSVGDLVAVLTRQRRGYLELGIASHAGARGRSVLAAVRGPQSAWDAGWYVLLTLAARRRADRLLRRTAQQQRAWERDGSSRPGTPAPG